MANTRGAILVFRVGQLGDTLISIPALRAIEARHPINKRILLTQGSVADGRVSVSEVLAPLNIFHEVVVYDSSLRGLQMARQLLEIAFQLRKLAPEYTYNLAPYRSPVQHLRDQFFFKALVGTRRYVASGPIVRPKPNPPLHRLRGEWQRLLEVVGEDKTATSSELPVSDADRRRAEQVLAPLSTAKRLVGLGPGSNMPAKIWPRERFLQVGERLLHAQPDIGLVVLGGKADTELGEWLCRAWGPRALNLAGKLGIYESAAVLRKCDVYVGNDTGTMHLAAMSGTPCVALFSARDYPGIWDPIGQSHTVLRAQIECEGCMLVECKIRRNECLEKISVERVFAHVERNLAMKDGQVPYGRP